MTETDKVEKPGPLFRGLVSMAIVVYAFVLALQMSMEQPLRNRLVLAVGPILDYTALWQNFAVFSPNPRTQNIYLSAIVTMADGSAEYLDFARMDRLAFWDKASKERLRKFILDNAYADKDRMLWPDLARYIARQVHKEGKKPIAISLHRHWSEIPPPEQGLGKQLPADYRRYTIYVLYLTPEDLR